MFSNPMFLIFIDCMILGILFFKKHIDYTDDSQAKIIIFDWLEIALIFFIDGDRFLKLIRGDRPKRSVKASHSQGWNLALGHPEIIPNVFVPKV